MIMVEPTTTTEAGTSGLLSKPSRKRRPKVLRRVAPSGGYDYPAKAAFRKWVWDRIGGALPDGTTINGNVLLMPSVEGLEISEEAIPRGFSLSQLHVVDSSPAVVATIKRKFPEVNTYGVSVEKAISRITVPLIAANLDFCGNISLPLLRSIRAVSLSPISERALIFVTVLRGREEPAITSLMQGEQSMRRVLVDYVKNTKLDNGSSIWQSDDAIEPTDLDVARIVAITRTAERRWILARAYTSVNGQSFLTVCLEHKNPPTDPLEQTRRMIMNEALRTGKRYLEMLAEVTGMSEASLLRLGSRSSCGPTTRVRKGRAAFNKVSLGKTTEESQDVLGSTFT